MTSFHDWTTGPPAVGLAGMLRSLAEPARRTSVDRDWDKADTDTPKKTPCEFHFLNFLSRKNTTC